MGKSNGNGDKIPEATEEKLDRIKRLTRIRDAEEDQKRHKAIHEERERSRQARVRAQKERRKKEDGK